MGRIAMKQKIMIVVLGGLLLAGCISCNIGPDKMKVEREQAGRDKDRSMPGGWSHAEVTPDVEHALDYVLKQMNTSAGLEKIITVKTQVVAGLNYSIDFQLDNGEIWNVKVFRDLSGNYAMIKPATRKGMATSN
jgi:hypothetical protein